jgi:hypothetical protein
LKPEGRFQHQAKDFWAHARLLSQEIGYTEHGTGRIRVLALEEVEACFHALGLHTRRIRSANGKLTEFGSDLFAYFDFRARVLNQVVRPLLMEAKDAKRYFKSLRKRLKPTSPIPMNKQKGEKRQPAYLTAIINMLVEANSEGFPCDYDPRGLTIVTRNGSPARTLARRVDGAFPSVVDPIAIWEVKEYYYTTTFGSRVADGVYESLLDGMELRELHSSEGIHIRHYLMVDARYTWWECGKSYLCRLVDMLHMGYVDEVLFGREVIERTPELVKEWIAVARQRRPVL